MNNPKLITQNLGSLVQQLAEGATSLYLLLAFIRPSGVNEIFPTLQHALDAGAEIKILTGDYLGITDPDALARLLTLGPELEVRMWRTSGETFHPKAYLFESPTALHVVVGSSNLSRSALTQGVEWNLLVEDAHFHEADPVTVFLQLFYADETVPLNAVTLQDYRQRREIYGRAASLAKVLWGDETVNPPNTEHGSPLVLTEPVATDIVLRPVQVEALRALQTALEEGVQRGLVVLPTGLGKTYLAAFFAQSFRRVLFVAHRDEILRQAAHAFSHVLRDRTTAFYTGLDKGHADMIFASVFTLASRRHREHFAADAFDLIVVDEFHHAAAPSYEALLRYFRPRFLLGLTATPERRDHRDIYALTDGNLVFQETLPEAINQGWLAPFHYYGIYDPTDYQALPWRRTHYDEQALAAVQAVAAFAAWVYENWRQHRGLRTLAFCAGVAQARYFADYFGNHGVKAYALLGSTPREGRRAVLHAFDQGNVDVIFSVDLFNEGLDVPNIDTIMLIRPTDSTTIFLQQIGRGLRPAPGKAFCTIIDFVGNYRNAEERFSVLGVQDLSAALAHERDVLTEHLPLHCFIALDLQVIDVLTKLTQRQTPRRQLALNALKALKEDLGRCPNYLEFHLKSGIDSKMVRSEFKSFVGLLSTAGELTPFEETIYQKTKGWLATLETTAMSQSYKMVLLLAMLARGDAWDEPVTAEALAFPFYAYLHAEQRWRRERQPQKLFGAPYDEAVVASLLKRNPIRYLAASAPSHFRWDGRYFSAHHGATTPSERALLARWTHDIVDYRLHRYFERQ
ncbi:MAG: DEAD/DEAH box helicase family protein [Firmicutes bacterium]|nr:DEAD/DEAH box helicase family protein [Bacillota bacterium]